MKTTYLALAAFGLLAAPAFADAMMDPAKMTCAEFSKLDKDGMMKAVDMMHKAGPDATMAMDDDAMKTAGETVMTGCEGHDDMMAMDALMKKM